jgi:hypothetical protein
MKTVFDLLDRVGLVLESDVGVVLLLSGCAVPVLCRLHGAGVFS